MRYITLISINSKFSRKVSALIELFYAIKTPFTLRECTRSVLLRWGEGGSLYPPDREITNMKNFLFRLECFSEPAF